MQINNRLKRVSEYIPNNSSIIDVGCDHALLDIYLFQTKENINCIASDINLGPLKKAKENVSKYNLSHKIIIKQGNGIENLNKETDTIVISGMGGNNIINIIQKDKEALTNIKRIVLSPNNDFFLIRDKMIKLGYAIEKEEIFKDKNKYYLIISFIKGKRRYKKKELIYGNLIKNRDYYEYLKNEIDKSINKLNNIPKKYIVKRLNLKLNIYNLKKCRYFK